MSKKLMLLAAGALIALTFAATPSPAIAGEWECETSIGAICGVFEGVNNTSFSVPTEDGSSNIIGCTGAEFHGEYITKTTGEHLTITFRGCRVPGATCTSAGQPAGTIKTFDLPFHNVMIEATGAPGFVSGTPGILITPNPGTGEFAEYSCGLPVHLKGNGLVVDLTKTCGQEVAAGANMALDFESLTSGTQKWTQIETTGTIYDLSALTTTPFGNTTRTASEDGEASIHFATSTRVTCP